MRRTSASALIVLGLVGGVAAFLVQTALASAGRPILTVPFTLPIALAAIGSIVVVLALPIRRTTRRRTSRSRGMTADAVDPFYATRVVALAKACALTGALLCGAGAGALLYVLTGSANPAAGSIAPAAGILVGSAVLLVCGLVAESMCRIPPEDDEDGDDDGQPLRATP